VAAAGNSKHRELKRIREGVVAEEEVEQEEQGAEDRLYSWHLLRC